MGAIGNALIWKALSGLVRDFRKGHDEVMGSNGMG